VPASSPVVFDDNNELDHRRIQEICDDIVALAADRQIMIFAHDMWFAAELLSKADTKTRKYNDIRLEGSDAGVVAAAVQVP
jgi:hypothetical protein